MGKQDGEGDSRENRGRHEHTHSLNTRACGSAPGMRVTGPFLGRHVTHIKQVYMPRTHMCTHNASEGELFAHGKPNTHRYTSARTIRKASIAPPPTMRSVTVIPLFNAHDNPLRQGTIATPLYN